MLNSNDLDSKGDVIAIGDWKRTKELGSGSFGIVSLWINNVTEERIAIKKCRWLTDKGLTSRQRDRWISEVKMMQEMKHENIVSFKEMPAILGEALLQSNPTKLPILSMEYCSMGNLRDVLELPQNACGFCEMQVVDVLNDISNALKYLHQIPITHRDIKPENIVLQKCNTRQCGIVYKIIDLGYAKELGTSTLSFVGTFAYLAPEIYEQAEYTRSVDYWSLGITAFEIVCGIRPFLPTFNPAQSHNYIKQKSPDTICIQLTHVGEIQRHKELLKENHLNVCLKQDIEMWLRSVLQYNAEERGSVENNNVDVFESLQNIFTKKIITVFSVYTYEFHSYEINSSTLYSTLEDWIARDIQIPKSSQCIVPSKSCNSVYAIDYYNQNVQTMLYVFKRGAYISDDISTPLPRLIKVMFENTKTEFKFGTYKILHSHVIYLLSQEIKNVQTLKSGIYFLCDLLKRSFVNESSLFNNIRDTLKSFLSEIEFYNIIEMSLFRKSYGNVTAVEMNGYLMAYQRYMQQLQRIADVVNSFSQKQKTISIRHYQLLLSSNSMLDILKNCDFSLLVQQAIKYYQEVVLLKPFKNCTVSRELFGIISKTIKIRDSILRNELLLHFAKAATSQLKELDKLLDCLTTLKTNLMELKTNVRQNIINRLLIVQHIGDLTNRGSVLSEFNFNDGEVITENVSLRYELQKFMSFGILHHSNSLKEVPENDPTALWQ